MEKFRPEDLIHANADIGLKVYKAKNSQRAGSLFVKQYHCTSIEQGDILLKNAVALAQKPFEAWAGLQEVAVQPVPRVRQMKAFTIDFVYEKYANVLPQEIIVNNDRIDTGKRGISNYELQKRIYHSDTNDLSVHIAVNRDTQAPVVVKISGRLNSPDQATPMVNEALMQSHVVGEFTMKLVDIAMYVDGGGYRVALVLEKMEGDTHNEMEQRVTESRPYTEAELMKFMRESVLGLLQAKIKKIAHRDIKPENIFVSSDGKYKLGDFGASYIHAKSQLVIEDEAEEGAPIANREVENSSEDVTGTPKYMSPEILQLFASESGSIDTFASDIFSLGITFLEVALLHSPERPEAERRAEEQGILYAQIDTINFSDFVKNMIKKMVATDPAERPLLEELQLSLEVTMGIYRPQAPSNAFAMCPSQLIVESNKLRAEIQHLEAKGQSLGLAESYLHYAFVSHAQHNLVRAEEFAKKALSIREAILPPLGKVVTKDQAISFGEVYDALGGIYMSLGRYWEAFDIFDKSLDLKFNRLPFTHPLFATIYSRLGDASRCLYEPVKAYTYYNEDLRLKRERDKRDPVGVGRILLGLAQIASDNQRKLEHCEDAQSVLLRFFPPDHIELATLYTVKADAYCALGDFDSAWDLCQRGIEIREKWLSDAHPDRAESYDCLARICLAKDLVLEAEASALSAFGARQLSLREEHSAFAATHEVLGAVYERMGKVENAAEQYLKELALMNSLFGNLRCNDIYKALASRYEKAGSMLLILGRLDEAEQAILKAIESTKRGIQPQAREADLLMILGEVYMLCNARDSSTQAGNAFMEASNIRRRASPWSPEVVLASYGLARARCLRNDPEMKSYYNFAESVRNNKHFPIPADSPCHIANHYTLLFMALRKNDGATAKREGLEYLRLRQATLHPEHLLIAEAQHLLARAYLLTGEPEKAQEALEASYRIRKGRLPDAHPLMAEMTQMFASMQQPVPVIEVQEPTAPVKPPRGIAPWKLPRPEESKH